MLTSSHLHAHRIAPLCFEDGEDAQDMFFQVPIESIDITFI